MGICWSCTAGKLNEASVAEPAGDASFIGNTGNSWFSMATNNFTSWISQASDGNAAIWGDDNKFPVAPYDEDLPDSGMVVDSQFIAFTFEQLKAATFNFRSDMMLGRAGFASVCKGWLKEKPPSVGTKKRPIAVKKLDSSTKAELSNRQLQWEPRLKIAVGMAQGLSCLHTMDKPIIFRDFKSSNILLDESYNPKISEFGLAKWGPTEHNSFVTGHLMGTKGYADPCYISRGKLYVKSDCYSFGVVLLEILTGLRAFDKRRLPGKHSLVDWYGSLPSSRRNLRQQMDSRLEGKYPPKQASEVFVLAVRCVDGEPQRRSSMKEVAETLERIQARA